MYLFPAAGEAGGRRGDASPPGLQAELEQGRGGQERGETLTGSRRPRPARVGFLVMAAAVVGWESGRENVSGIAIAAAPRPSQTVPEVRAPPLASQSASKTDTKNDRENALAHRF